MQNITIPTPTGQQITGHLRPVAGSTRLLVLCHGFRSSHEQPALQAIAKGLHAKGHAVLTFNFSDSSGFYINHQVRDIQTLVAHFAEYSEIVLLAGSLGALNASIAVLEEPRLTGLVTVNGFFGSGMLRGKMRAVFYFFRSLTAFRPSYRESWHYFKSRFAPERIAVPVLVIHSRVDETVMFAQSQQFYAALTSPKEFVELHKTNHDLTNGQEIGLIISSIDTWLASSFSKK